MECQGEGRKSTCVLEYVAMKVDLQAVDNIPGKTLYSTAEGRGVPSKR